MARMTRTEALERVIASLRNEIEALTAFDIEALAAATAGRNASSATSPARAPKRWTRSFARWHTKPPASTRPRG